MKETIATTDIDLSHHLQRAVLLQLRQNGPSTYQQLKPDGVEGNAYNYHLRLLKNAQLIILREGLYRLSGIGHLVSDAYSFEKKRLVLRPYTYTVLLVTSGDSMLIYTPSREPLHGKVVLPSGKLHYGDDFNTSIAREMTRRGLSSAYEASSICPINVRYLIEGATAIHRPGMLWHIDYHGPLADRRTESGSSTWVTQADAHGPTYTPEVSEALARLANQSTQPIDLEWPLE